MLLPLLACADPPAPSGPPSIVLVSLDTTRADRLGAWGSAAGLTPSLDRFAEEAVVFTRAYAQSNSTASSHRSVFTSRYPCEPTSDAPTLAEILHTYGYATAAFSAGGELARGGGFERGFDTYSSSLDFGSFWHTAPPATVWLAEHRDGPVFEFVHSYDAHARYLKPTPFTHVGDVSPPLSYLLASSKARVIDGFLHADTNALAWVSATYLRARSEPARTRLAEMAPDAPLLDETELAHVRRAYDDGVAYMDVGFGMLMASLQAQGRLDDAWVVVFADHGEQLGEDGMFDHPFALTDAETHVPLMIRAPRGEGGGRHVDALVELSDILPTLVELAGGVPPADMRGTSLLPAVRGEPLAGHDVAFSVGGWQSRIVSVRSPEARLTYTGVSAGSRVLPDLVAAASLPGPGFDGEADPALRDRLVARLRSLPANDAVAKPAPLRQGLRDRGYF
ncbi:MAG: sulfatase [Myxococcota bacterium]